MYAQPQDLIARFTTREMGQVLGTPDVADSRHPRLVAACEDAAAIADGYLSRAYPLPLRTVPAALVSATADIARYRLHDDQVREGGDTGKTTIRLRYEDAVRWLEAVADGKVALFPGNAGEGDSAPQSPFPLRGNHRIAVVASPVIFDQATLDRMDGAKR